MNDVKIVRECLDTILKKGDIYDTIAEREGVKFQRYSFVRNHILLFSRILYVGVRVGEKVRSLFSPIHEVKRAQDKIRKIVGVNIDIIKSKHVFNLLDDTTLNSDDNPSIITMVEKSVSAFQRSNHPTLSVFYENSNMIMEEYLEHLKKILAFCDLYKLDEILLNEDDIASGYPDLDLTSYPHTNMKKVLDYTITQESAVDILEEEDRLNCTYDIERTFSSSLLFLNKKELRRLIKQLEVVRISKKVVKDLGNKIEDIPVRNAIAIFLSKGDLQNLRSVVSNRLNLLLNSDSSYKDKEHGKLFQSITIKEGYVNIISTKKNGEVVSNIVTTLYDYLGILDYKCLLREIENRGDNQEVLCMSALHLYLSQSVKIKEFSKEPGYSFYDYIYTMFQAKKRNRVSTIPGLYRKADRRYKSICHLFSDAIVSFFLVLLIIITGVSFDFIQQVAFQNEDSNILSNLSNTIITPYIKSYEFEEKIIDRFFSFTYESALDFARHMKEGTGDAAEGIANSDKILAHVNRIQDVELPTYFASGYATNAEYKDGYMTYFTESKNVTMDDFGKVEELFQVSCNLGSDLLDKLVVENQISFPKIFYPIGSDEEASNYVLSRIYIYDESDEFKRFTIDESRMSISGNVITSEELELLKSMSNPKIVYVYGIGYGSNSFVEDMEKTGPYTSNSPEDIRNAIIKGLGLEKTATDIDIYNAIASKNYSLTPIKDSGLSWRIKWFDEKKFFEKVASMDSLICNLAATLVVGTDEELIYTVGYLNQDDEYIRENEGHAWAMSEDGKIVDIALASSTSKKDEIEIIANIIHWGTENHLPFYALISFASYLASKLLGKKVKIRIKVSKVRKILTASDIEDSYAKLKESLYGGLTLPVDRTPLELAEIVEKEFGSFSIEELKEIRRELTKRNFNCNGELDSALQLLDEVPFLKNSSPKVKRMIRKKLQK